ncbi:DUF2786 domain-containing protein [Protofrankia symbiont of Coriaria ruscifolia]|uniref:DUF2786 domain-containing protein n=1 Tax=Candidatus Protofrankia californiensis TaxID=1839754 RepID=A0A1C3PCZ2_9ACTN|nr:DUF2786 domain-containing protein [Protofrankia symbiont of Coriaria ruscifolia]SBW27695.1 hypothetical protein FDG2_5404 [Candidatus Protofrankia californiensis]
MDADAALGKIRKLLAMAEAEGLPEQARESYNDKAADLIAQYGIDRALLEEAVPTRAVAGDVVLNIDHPYARDKITLLAGIAGPLGCRLIHRTHPLLGATAHTAHLFGMAADLERTQILYTSLLVQQAHALALVRVPPSEDARAFRRSWMAGFAIAVQDRLTKAEAAARERHRQGPACGRSVELVFADRSARVDRHVAEVYPRLRTTRSRNLSGSGGPAGFQAGQRADIGTDNRVAGNPRRKQL